MHRTRAAWCDYGPQMRLVSLTDRQSSNLFETLQSRETKSLGMIYRREAKIKEVAARDFNFSVTARLDVVDPFSPLPSFPSD